MLEERGGRRCAFDNTIYGRGRWRINFYGDQVAAAFDIVMQTGIQDARPGCNVNCVRRATLRTEVVLVMVVMVVVVGAQ